MLLFILKLFSGLLPGIINLTCMLYCGIDKAQKDQEPIFR